MTVNERRSADQAPLRIAYLFQQFPLPTEAFAVSDVAALLAQGHRVTIYTMKRSRRNERDLLHLCGVPAGLSIDRPSASGALSWPQLLWRSRRPALALARRIAASWASAPREALEALLCMPRLVEIAERIKADNVDVAHAFWSRHVGLVLPLLEAHEAPTLRSAFVGAYDLIADDFLVGMTLQSAETVFSHAGANRAYVNRKAPGEATRQIIARGIPLLPLASDARREPYRCITASALTASKNVDDVIDACALAREREPRLTLHIFGEGPDRARLEQLSRERGGGEWISFGGHVSRGELFAQMQRASVFLLLSRKPSERLPNVIKEALWAGCSVISAKSEGIEELIPDPGVGQIVDPVTPEGASAALVKALGESEEDAAKRRVRGRAMIEQRFSSDHSMRRYVEAWREAIARRRQPPRPPAPRAGRIRRQAPPAALPVSPPR
jgi:glycosyltransferase involved in cell wall biosynthesis